MDPVSVVFVLPLCCTLTCLGLCVAFPNGIKCFAKQKKAAVNVGNLEGEGSRRLKLHCLGLRVHTQTHVVDSSELMAEEEHMGEPVRGHILCYVREYTQMASVTIPKAVTGPLVSPAFLLRLSGPSWRVPVAFNSGKQVTLGCGFVSDVQILA